VAKKFEECEEESVGPATERLTKISKKKALLLMLVWELKWWRRRMRRAMRRKVRVGEKTEWEKF